MKRGKYKAHPPRACLSEPIVNIDAEGRVAPPDPVSRESYSWLGVVVLKRFTQCPPVSRPEVSHASLGEVKAMWPGQ